MPLTPMPKAASHPQSQSFRGLMLRVVLVVSVPLLGIALLSTLDGVRRERARFDDQMVQTARAMAIALDGEIARVGHAVRILGTALDTGAVVADGELRQAVWREMDGPALGLMVDADGRVVLEGDAWPGRAPGPVILDRELLAAARALPGTLVSDVLPLPGGGFAVAAVRPLAAIPPAGLVAMLVPSSRFGQVLQAQRLPEGWVAAVVDRQGRVAARTRAEQEFLGALAMPRTMAMLAEAQAGVAPNSTTHDGMRSTTAAARAPLSGYAVVIAAPAPGTLQDLQTVLGGPAIAGALLVLVAIWGAGRITAHFLSGIAALAPGAPPTASGVRELDDAAARLRAAEAAQAAAMQRLERSEARYRIATEAFSGGIYECRPADDVVLRSPGHLAIIGEAADQPQREWWLGRVHPEDRPLLDEAIQRVRAGETDRFDLQYRVRHGRGHHIWVWHRSIAARDPASGAQIIVGSVTDISAERAARDGEVLVAREMEHRVKNSFTLVTSLVSLTAARFPQARELAAELRARIMALTAAHDLVHQAALSTTLHALVRRMSAPYASPGAAMRITLQGDDTPLRPALVPQFGLVLHEWLTNAAKYGALSTPEGSLRLTMRRLDEELLLEWEESGGPPIAEPPEEMGFGSMLLAATVHALGARMERDWRREGLRLTLALPLGQLDDPEAATLSRA